MTVRERWGAIIYTLVSRQIITFDRLLIFRNKNN